MAQKIINLTPHPISVWTMNGRVTFQPTGRIARLTIESKDFVREVEGVSITRTVYGPVEGLPEQEFSDDKYYIVSQMVKHALPDRDDLVVVVGRRRNGRRVTGCESLGI